MADEVVVFSSEMGKHLLKKEKTDLELEIRIAGVSVKGLVDDIYDNRFIQYRYAAIKGKDILNFWIPYLMLNNAGEKKDRNYGGLLAGVEKNKSGKIWTGYLFDPVPLAGNYFESLISLYIDGICMPLPFFPESSLTFAEAVLKKVTPGMML